MNKYQIDINGKTVELDYEQAVDKDPVRNQPLATINSKPFDLWHLYDFRNSSKGVPVEFPTVKICGEEFTPKELDSLYDWATTIERERLDQDYGQEKR